MAAASPSRPIVKINIATTISRMVTPDSDCGCFCPQARRDLLFSILLRTGVVPPDFDSAGGSQNRDRCRCLVRNSVVVEKERVVRRIPVHVNHRTVFLKGDIKLVGNQRRRGRVVSQARYNDSSWYPEAKFRSRQASVAQRHLQNRGGARRVRVTCIRKDL